jgi:hypothetical protein
MMPRARAAYEQANMPVPAAVEAATAPPQEIVGTGRTEAAALSPPTEPMAETAAPAAGGQAGRPSDVANFGTQLPQEPTDPMPQDVRDASMDVTAAITGARTEQELIDRIVPNVEKMVRFGMGGAATEQLPAEMEVGVRGAPGETQPLSEAEEAASQLAADLTERYHARWQAFQAGELKRLREAEQDANTAIKDAEMFAQYGMPADQVRMLNETMTLAASNPDDISLQIKAREAQAILGTAEAEASNMDPNRLWNDMGGAQKALFLFFNSLSIVGNALARTNVPTPWETLNDLMDRDYREQVRGYNARQGRVTKARTAYDMAAKMTDSAIEREALAKDMMWGAFEMEARRLGLARQAQNAADQRVIQRNALTMSKHRERWNKYSDMLNLVAQRENASFALGVKQQQAHTPPQGMEFLPGAPPLTPRTRENIAQQHQYLASMMQGVEELIQLRSNPGMLAQVMNRTGMTSEAGVMKAKFAEIVDDLRKFYNWGARFEQTEAEKLVGGYLGAATPTAIDFFGEVEAGLREFMRQMPIRWWTGLQTGYGLVPRGAEFTPAQLSGKDVEMLKRAVRGSTAQEPQGAGEYEPEFR